jgi:hypothetical protein
MHRPNRDELDDCPNCGDPVWRSHRCTAPARPPAPKPANFDELVERARRQARGQVDDPTPEQLRLYDAALRQDVGL